MLGFGCHCLLVTTNICDFQIFSRKQSRGCTGKLWLFEELMFRGCAEIMMEEESEKDQKRTEVAIFPMV